MTWRGLAFALALGLAAWAPAWAQGLLPNGMQQFTDPNGAPYAGGSVYFYTPGTTSAKATWQDAAETTLNTNPVVLDAAGRAAVWGNGQYREVLYDANANLIWDRLTSAQALGTTHAVVISEGVNPQASVLLGSGQVLVGQGSAGDPTSEGLSALLDSLFGSAEGDILYRGASAWITLPPGTSGQFLQTQGSGAAPLWASASITNPGRLLDVVTFTVSGTYTPNAGLGYALILAAGGGASGGGTPACPTGKFTAASGGGPGGVGMLYVAAATVGASQTVTIGAAGAAPSAGANNGNSGGTTSVGSLISASGGGYGITAAAGTTPFTVTAGGSGSATGTGVIPLTSNNGGTALANGTASYAGWGGNGYFGTGGSAPATSGSSGAFAGNPGSGYGAGGSGSVCYNTNTAEAGGAGTAGFVLIYEYSAS
jgi:hypothetical protein